MKTSEEGEESPENIKAPSDLIVDDSSHSKQIEERLEVLEAFVLQMILESE